MIASSCAALMAQRTFVIDAQNGPGTNFTDLPQALAQAQHRDVYVMRPGFYSPASTDKGVTLLGPGATVTATTAPAIMVQNLPAGQTFTMRIFTVSVSGTPSAIVLQSSAGRVILEEVSIGALGANENALVISQCRMVAIAHSSISGTTTTTDSTLVLVDSSLRARSLGFPSSAPALVATRSAVQISGGSCTGGNGIAFGQGWTTPSEGILATGGSLWLAPSDQPLALRGGSVSTPTGIQGAPAASVTDTQVLLDPAVTLTSASAPYKVAGTTTVDIHTLPSLAATHPPLGGSSTLTVRSAPGDQYFLVAGAPADPTPLWGGLLFLDATSLVTLAMATQAPGGTTTLGLVVPNTPSLLGAPVGFQAASFTTAMMRIELSNASLHVLQ